jgi:hypothetical protein
MEKPTTIDNNSAQDLIRFEYEQALETIRMLADIRFKLLALVPFVSGATIAFLSADPADAPPQAILAGSVAGFLVTIGVAIYNLRNTQSMNVTRARCVELENLLKPPVTGQFHSHQPPSKLFYVIPLWADLGLAIIYGTVLAAWLFLIMHTMLNAAFDSFLGRPVDLFAILITAVAGLVLIFEIIRLDERSKCCANAEVEVCPSKRETTDPAAEGRALLEDISARPAAATLPASQ